MAATDAQITEIRDLQAAGEGYATEIPLSEWDQTVGEYNYAPNDPYELAMAEITLASPTFAVTPDDGDPSLDLTSASPTVNINASITYKGTPIVDDSAFTFSTIAMSLTVDGAGLVTYDGTGTGSGDVRVSWKRNESVFATRRVNYTP